MTTPVRFAAAELIGMAILADVGAPVVQSTSTSLTPPLVRVRRVPGEPRGLFEDPAHLEVMTFGATFQASQALAERCWVAVEFAYAKAFALEDGSTVTVDHTATILSPTEVPWANPDVRVHQATYLVLTRPLPA